MKFKGRILFIFILCIFMYAFIFVYDLSKHPSTLVMVSGEHLSHITSVTSHVPFTEPFIHSYQVVPGIGVLLYCSSSTYNLCSKQNITTCIIEGKNVTLTERHGDIFVCSGNLVANSTDVITVRTQNGGMLPSIASNDNNILKPDTKHDLCIASMIKDEEDYIQDWVLYHKKQGVSLFLLYNNNSTDKTIQQTAQYNEIIWMDWPWVRSQMESAMHGMFQLKNICKWTFFLDVDEYVYPVYMNGGYTMRHVLNNLGNIVGNQSLDINQVCLASKLMSTSNLINKPKLSVPEAYTHFHVWSPRSQGKCVVRTQHILLSTNVNHFNVRGATLAIDKNIMHIVHYPFKCWNCFLKKLKKGSPGALNTNWGISGNGGPPSMWTNSKKAKDTSFRDYKRKLDD